MAYINHLVDNETDREFVIMELHRKVRELQSFVKLLKNIIGQKNKTNF